MSKIYHLNNPEAKVKRGPDGKIYRCVDVRQQHAERRTNLAKIVVLKDWPK